MTKKSPPFAHDRSGRPIGRADGDAVSKQKVAEFAATLRFRAY
jgi:hypothetical protein